MLPAGLGRGAGSTAVRQKMKSAARAQAATPKAAGRKAAATSPRVAAGAPAATGRMPGTATVPGTVGSGSGSRNWIDPNSLSRRQRRAVGRGLNNMVGNPRGGARAGFARRNRNKLIAGGVAGAYGVGSLYQNTGPGVTGNGYVGTGASSGGRGF